MTPILITITGGSGSGKSTITDYIVRDIFPGQTTVIGHDRYYRPLATYAPDEPIDRDAPESLEDDLLVAHVRQLLAGEAVLAPVYDYDIHDRLPEAAEVTPAPIIIVEGIHTLGVPALRELATISLFVHADDDVRLARRLRRDFIGGARVGLGEGGDPKSKLASDLDYYFTFVKPNYDRHIGPLAAHADAVIENNLSLADTHAAVTAALAHLR